MTPFLAEVLGTMLLIVIGDGVVANVLLSKTKGNNGGIISVTTAWALGVFIGVVVAGPYSGAHLNPAVSIGLAVAGKFAWDQVPMYVLAQMLGSMSGALLVWLAYRDHFNDTKDPGLVLGVFCTGPAIRKPFNNIITEVIGTFVLMFVIFYIAGGSMQDTAGNTTAIGLGSVGALPVAFLVWAIGLALGGPTGYAINPARDLGPRIMHAILPIRYKGGSDWGYSMIPVIAPIIGAILASWLYLNAC